MTSEILCSAINDDEKLILLINSLENNKLKDENIFTQYSCTKSDFITYFLNFIHENVPCNDAYEKKFIINTPKHLERNLINTTTPKRTNLLDKYEKDCSSKKYSSNIQNTSYTSPVSPLYSSYVTPKNKKQNTHKSPFCLGDFIINDKTKKKTTPTTQNDFKINSRTRRINPTNINHNLNTNFNKNSNSFNFNNDYIELPIDNITVERKALVEERNKIITNVIKTPKKIQTTIINKLEIKPELDLVNYKKNLDSIIKIYTTFIKNNFVLNICNELYFLIFLLLSKQYDCCNDGFDILYDCTLKIEPKELFKTIHNVIYFTTKTIENQLELLNILDKSTIKLLIDNVRLNNFVPNLIINLIKIYESKCERILEIYDSNIQTNVCFISDTDNRDNFPNDQSFHAFRKQRDLFYEILRLWENNRMQPTWNYTLSLSGKIRSLINLSNDSANLLHLSRLFKSQLLSSCGKLGVSEEGVSEDHVTFLTSVTNVNAEKLKRLKIRLVQKQSTSGINSLPTFTGHQEFFKEFIVVAGNHNFIKHLSDSLITEIIELNDSKFDCTEIEDSERIVDATTQKSFQICIKTLRILAKFLGFIESLPYQTETITFSENVLDTCIKIRKNIQPSLDIKQLLSKSIKNCSLIVIIPWLTKYLSMLDYVTLRLPYYENVLNNLFDLYLNINSIKSVYSMESKFLIKFCLGWLFELPHFPDGLYFNYFSGRTNELENKIVCSNDRTIHLDKLELTNQNILYDCCPYLEEIRKLLLSDVSNENVTVKHITPLTAVQSPNEIASKRLENQLQEAFFNGQPISTRRSVEFVSERIASTCVKHICNTIVPDFKKTIASDFKKFLNDLKDEEISLNSDSYINFVKQKANDYLIETVKKLQDVCNKEVIKIISDKLPPCMESLLPLDALKQTKDACVAITSRMCSERVNQWLMTRITVGIFSKDFESAVQTFLSSPDKKLKEKVVLMLPPGGKNIKHNPNALSAVDLMELTRKYCRDVMENGGNVTHDSIMNLLEEASRTFQGRCDVNDCILNVTNRLLVDLVLLLITHSTNLMLENSFFLKFDSVWNFYCGFKDDLFKTLICPRNIMMLAQSSDITLAWKIFGKFIAFLIKQKCLSCDNFEGQCIGIFKKDWDEVTLGYLTNCFKNVLDDIRHDVTNEKLAYLISFLSDFCSDLAI